MRVLDLFCGAGGFSLGLQNAGMKPVLAVDSWMDAVDCYNANLPPHAFTADMVKDFDLIVDRASATAIDLVCGGPPCQDFSNAGPRVEGERAALTVVFAELIAALDPDWFVMENVPDCQKSVAVREAVRIFSANGYHLHPQVLNAAYHNVPQKRKRFFLIGRRDCIPMSLSAGVKETLMPMTMRQHFDSVGEPVPNTYYRDPRMHRRSRATFSADETALTVLCGNRPPPPRYFKEHPEAKGVRRLTVRERGVLQTFPPDWQWPEVATTANKMIGNAVPPNLAEAVGRHILESMS